MPPMTHFGAFLIGLSSVVGIAGLAVTRDPVASGRPGARSEPALADFRALAEAFVDTLSDRERGAALRPLGDPERTTWYFARGDRAGLFLRDMDPETRRAALALVDAFLSASGREQWRLIRRIEALNAEDERRAGAAPPTYGDDLYAVHLFGSPLERAWAFEIEGHHFVLHAAVVDGVATVTPLFTGAYPAAVPRGADEGRRPLGAAVAVAFELARSLDATQRAKARIMDRPPADVLWAVGADARPPEPLGIARSELAAAQQALVDRLLAEHAALLDERVAEAQLRRWREMRAKPDADPATADLVFAFVGETDLAKPHYYRLATQCFTIEYDSTNADASHVHCVWSDPFMNFGGDALRKHLREAHR